MCVQDRGWVFNCTLEKQTKEILGDGCRGVDAASVELRMPAIATTTSSTCRDAMLVRSASESAAWSVRSAADPDLASKAASPAGVEVERVLRIQARKSVELQSAAGL